MVCSILYAWRFGAAHVLLRTIILGVLFVAHALCANTLESAATITIATDADQNTYYHQIRELFPTPQLLERLTFASDVCVNQEEFYYLVDLKQGTFISAEQLVRAVSYLVKKNKFSIIQLHVTPSSYGVSLHVDLQGFWTFARLKVRGVLMGKQRYHQYYLIDPGDQFDMVKHNHSIEKIVEAEKQKGYFNAQVTSLFSRDVDTKTVTVTITITHGQQFSISDVHLQVNADEYESSDELLFLKQEIYRKFFKRLPKSTYEKNDLNLIAKDVKQYLMQQGFLHTTIELDENIDHERELVQLAWRIDLHHKKSFIFWGNRFYSDDQLLDNILLFGRSAWLLPASLLAEEIERAYRNKGFWDVHIESQEEAQRYFFLITEGTRASVDSVELQNVHHGDTHILVKKSFSELLRRHYFSQEALDHAFNTLLDWHLKQGFLDARILRHEFVPLEKSHTYKLIVTLEQGNMRYLKDVAIPDFPEFLSVGPFRRVHKAKEPIPFRMSLVCEQQEWLLNKLQQRGYKQVRVKPELIKDDTNGIAIRWDIDLDIAKVRFGKTILLGSMSFPFECLLRELQYKQGDLWDQDKLKQSFLRLKDLNAFESIHLYPHPSIDANNEQAVMLKVQKDDPFEVRLRAGLELQHVRKYQTFGGITYKLGGAFIAKNPTNAGDQFRLDVDFTRVHREIVAQYRRPWLLRLPFSGVFQGYSIKYDQPGFVGSIKNIYTVTQHGALLGLQKKKRHFDGGVNIGFEWMRTKINSDSVAAQECIAQLSKAINFEPSLLDRTVLFFQVEPNVFIDYLDHKLNPTRGFYTLLSLKGMFPIGERQASSYFVKLLAEQAFFIPMGVFVGAFRVRFGHIFHRTFNAIMPPERFYLGGSHSLRGYETDLTPPLGVFCDAKGKQNIVPRGGKSMANLNVELRFPLFKKLDGVIFHDTGMLSGDNFADFKPCNVLVASGFGVRFNTPVGPLRFDIGFKWRKDAPLDRSYAWVLTFGHAF